MHLTESVLCWGFWVGPTFLASTKGLGDPSDKQISTVSPTPVANIYHPSVPPGSQADGLGETVTQYKSVEDTTCPQKLSFALTSKPIPNEMVSKAELTRHKLLLLFSLSASFVRSRFVTGSIHKGKDPVSRAISGRQSSVF